MAGMWLVRTFEGRSGTYDRVPPVPAMLNLCYVSSILHAYVRNYVFPCPSLTGPKAQLGPIFRARADNLNCCRTLMHTHVPAAEPKFHSSQWLQRASYGGQ